MFLGRSEGVFLDQRRFFQHAIEPVGVLAFIWAEIGDTKEGAKTLMIKRLNNV